jgi:hypothetical protein
MVCVVYYSGNDMLGLGRSDPVVALFAAHPQTGQVTRGDCGNMYI